MKILIAGATGYLGRHMVAECRAQGHFVRALVRPGKRCEGADEIFAGEATSADTLEGLCEGMDMVFSSLGITRQREGLTYEAVDYGANLNVLRAAEAAGCERFGFVSVLNPDVFAQNPMVAARERFVRVLQASSIPSTVLRASGFFSDLEEVFGMAKAGRVYLFDDGEHRSNPIHGKDLAVACLEAMRAGTAELNVGGPEIFTAREVAEAAFAALGTKAKITRVPRWLSSLALALIKPFSSYFWTVGHFMRLAFTHDMLGERHGSLGLRDHYRALADSP